MVWTVKKILAAVCSPLCGRLMSGRGNALSRVSKAGKQICFNGAPPQESVSKDYSWSWTFQISFNYSVSLVQVHA